MSKSYFVTGGENSYVQSLIAKIIEQGNTVHALFTSPKQVPMNLLGKINLKFCFVDVERETNFEKSLPHMVDVIYHFYEADIDHKPNSRVFIGNALSTVLLLDWAKKIGAKEFILGSSAIIYGGGEDPVSETDRARPLSFATSTKYIAEMLAGFYHKSLTVKILRIFFPYGPKVNRGLIYELATRIKNDHAVEIPYTKITPTHVDDLVEILWRIGEVEGTLILNVSGNEVVELDEVVQQIGEIYGKSPKISSTAKQSLIADNKKLVKLLDYSFKTIFVDGLKNMLEEGAA